LRTAPGRDFCYAVGICSLNGVTAVWVKEQKSHGPQEFSIEISGQHLVHQCWHPLPAIFLCPVPKPDFRIGSTSLISAVPPEVGRQLIEWPCPKTRKMIAHCPHGIWIALGASLRQRQKLRGLPEVFWHRGRAFLQKCSCR